MEVEIGIGKSGRRAYGFDDIAIVPSRRTRDPEDVDISWELDAFKLDLPVIGSAMDGAISPRTAIEMGHLGGMGCLNLEGLWTRYDDPDVLFEEISELSNEKATRRMQEILHQKGIPATFDYWGHDVEHHWYWWRKMLRHHLAVLE